MIGHAIQIKLEAPITSTGRSSRCPLTGVAKPEVFCPAWRTRRSPINSYNPGLAECAAERMSSWRR